MNSHALCKICLVFACSSHLTKENGTVHTESTKEAARYEHPQDVKCMATYDTVSLNEEASENKQSTSGAATSIYEEVSTSTHTGLPNPPYKTWL